MKIAILFCFFFICLGFSSLAQVNLVPNPSFEDTLGCPQGYPDLDTKCQNWKSFRYSPDYMNDCSYVCGYYNQYGYQQPHSGMAFAGIATYQLTDSTIREHIGVQLTSPLVIGAKYYVSFFVSPAWNNLLTNIATNKVGALATTSQYSDNNGLLPLPNTCTFYSDSIIKDTLTWHKIFGSFVADSIYQYLVIGIFFDDRFIDTINFPYQLVPQVAYYYIDNVCLCTDSAYAETWTGLENQWLDLNDIKIYPNPIADYFYVKSDIPIQQIELINSLGQIVLTLKVENDFEIKVSSNDLSTDLYFLRIITKNGFYNKKIIINN